MILQDYLIYLIICGFERYKKSHNNWLDSSKFDMKTILRYFIYNKEGGSR